MGIEAAKLINSGKLVKRRNYDSPPVKADFEGASLTYMNTSGEIQFAGFRAQDILADDWEEVLSEP